MIIKEICPYKQHLGCAISERHCWNCDENPEVAYRKKQIETPDTQTEASRPGEPKPISWRTWKSVKKLPRIDWEKARRLYDEGLIDKEIAAQVDCSPGTVAQWRMKNDLDCQRDRKKKAKK